MNNKIFIISLLLSICYSQELGVGDTFPNDFGLPWCANNPNENLDINDSLYLNVYNCATNELGQHYVIYLMVITSWFPMGVTATQELFEIYQDSGLVVIGMGFDWGEIYYCEEWADFYELTYPILDDEGESDDAGDEEANNLFGVGVIPHHVVINHEMEIVFSASGWNGIEPINNAIQNALDSCGVKCLPGCSGVPGDMDGTFTINNEPIINVMDLIKLADIVSFGSEIDECLAVTGDLSDDGIVNLTDVYAFAAMISEGAFDN